MLVVNQCICSLYVINAPKGELIGRRRRCFSDPVSCIRSIVILTLALFIQHELGVQLIKREPIQSVPIGIRLSQPPNTIN